MLRQIVQDNLNKIACFGMRKAFLLRPYFFCEPCPVTRSGRSDLTKFSSPPPHESTSQIDKWKKKEWFLFLICCNSLFRSLWTPADLWPKAQSGRGETHHSLHYPSNLLSPHTTGPVLISTHTTIWDTWIWMPASHPGDQGVGQEVRVS